MLGNYGIHTSVFPSAHVAGAFSTAFGFRLAMPNEKRVYRYLFVIAVLIGIATIYGRYHYLADATCGAIIACLVSGFVTPGRAGVHISSPDATFDTMPGMKTAILPSHLLVGETNWHI